MIRYSHVEVEKDYISREKIIHKNNPKLFANIIDSTILKQDLTQTQVEEVCKDAIYHGFRAVCLPPSYMNYAHKLLNYHLDITKDDKNFMEKNRTQVCTVISFPLGYSSIETKVREVENAIQNYADEIDFVHNVTFVKNNNYVELEKEYLQIVKAAKTKLVKIILETALLTDEEIFNCSYLAAKCGVHVIKTSTGFSTRGVSLNDIKVIKNALQKYQDESGIVLGIKASGGIRSLDDATNLVQAGATRLGTSGGVAILEDKLNSHTY